MDSIDLPYVHAELAKRNLEEFLRLYAWPVLWPGTTFVEGWHVGAICEHLEAVSTGQIRRLIINMPFRMLKPARSDSHVIEMTRGRIRLDELALGNRVLTHRGRFRAVTAIQRQGELDVLRIETRAGRQVFTARDHPFLTPRGWIDAGQLCIGDTLAAVAPAEEHGGGLSGEEARLIGYLIGDGSCSQAMASFTNGTEEVLQDFERCAAALGFFTARTQRVGRAYSTCALKSSPTRGVARGAGDGPVTAWRKARGLFGVNSYTKRVPPAVMRAAPGAIAEFLGAYWSCDGTIATQGGYGRQKDGYARRQSFTARADTVSEGLARDLQHLLLRLGINAAVRRKVSNLKTAKQGDIYTSWTVGVPGDQRARFAASIPMVHAEKTRRLGLVVGGQFPRVLHEDQVLTTEPAGRAECMCIEVEEDSSFTANDIAVHNSTIISQTYPAWDWILNPSRQFLTASYAGDIAMRDAVDARRIIESQAYRAAFGDVFRLTTDQNVKGRYENDKRGVRKVTSTDSAGTGFGGDIRIIDDPVSAKRADSVLALNHSIEWWRGTMATRANDPAAGPVVVVHQRLNSRDLTGYLLAEEKGWDHLVLPMRFDSKLRKTTSLGFQDPRKVEGEVLHPARLPDAAVTELETSIGEYHRNAQLQQNPSPRGGIIFARSDWRFWRAEPEIEEIILSVDCTFKDVESSDFVAIQAWGVKGANKYLLKRRKERLNFAATCVAVRAMKALFPRAIAVLIEDKANGSAVIETIAGEVPGVLAINPEGGKVARAYAMQPEQQAGNIFLPDPSVDPKIEQFLEEASGFPGAPHDDEVDAMTQAINWIRVRRKAFGLLEFMKVEAQKREQEKATTGVT